MKQFPKYLYFVLLFLGCLSPSCVLFTEKVRSDPTQVVPAKVITYERDWRKIYFHGIEDRLVGTEIERLTDRTGSSGEIEVRVWAGFSTLPLRGLLFSKRGNNSSATYIRPRPDDSRSPCVRRLAEPKSGWPDFWKSLETRGIASLEDSDEQAKIDESRSLVVEINDRGEYRNYHYPGVFMEKGGNYATLAEFLRFLINEFGVDLLWEPMPNGPEVCHE